MNYLILLSLMLSLHASQTSSTSENNSGQTNTAHNQQPVEETKGYWVIQQQPDASGKVLVCYYNQQNELVKREWRTPENVDINRPKVMRSLRKALHEAIKLQTEENWN